MPPSILLGLHPLDAAIVVLSLLGTLVLGYWVSRRPNKKVGDFLVGGRKLGPLLQFFLNFGNMADSSGAPTIAAEVYREGVAGSWINFQLLFSTPFYWFFPVWFRRTRQVTFADLFIDRFNARRLAATYASLSALTAFGIIVMGNVISYKVASAMLQKPTSEWTQSERLSVDSFHEYENLRQKLGTPLWTTADQNRYSDLDSEFKHGLIQSYVSYLQPLPFYSIYALLVGTYVVMGGLQAAAIIDAFQGILIIILSFMMIPVGLYKVGGFAGLHDKVAEAHFYIFGTDTSNQYTWYSILAIIFTSTISTIAGVNMGPAAASAKDENSLRMGTVVGAFGKRIVTIAWILCGLLALALFPNGNGLSDTQNAWGAMAQVLLGPGLMGIMISGMILGHMPAVGVAAVNISALVTRNMYALVFSGKSEGHYLLVSKIAIPAVLVLSIPASMILTDFVAILSFLITFGAFMGTAGFLLYFWRRLTPRAIFIGMFLWLFLTCIAPWILPQSHLFSQSPALLKIGREQQVQVSKAATSSDVAAGLATKVGDTIQKNQTVPPSPLFFDAISRSSPSDANSPLEGYGRFNVECYLLSMVGFPVSDFNAAQLYTCRWLFDGLFPIIILTVLSYIPLEKLGRTPEQLLENQASQRARDDRFFIKMKTPINSNWEADLHELELRYADPSGSHDHLKIFPKSDWEFTKWSRSDIVGFSACWAVALFILFILYGVLHISF